MITRRHFLKIGGLTVAASGWISKMLGASPQAQAGLSGTWSRT